MDQVRNPISDKGHDNPCLQLDETTVDVDRTGSEAQAVSTTRLNETSRQGSTSEHIQHDSDEPSANNSTSELQRDEQSVLAGESEGGINSDSNIGKESAVIDIQLDEIPVNDDNIIVVNDMNSTCVDLVSDKVELQNNNYEVTCHQPSTEEHNQEVKPIPIDCCECLEDCHVYWYYGLGVLCLISFIYSVGTLGWSLLLSVLFPLAFYFFCYKCDHRCLVCCYTDRTEKNNKNFKHTQHEPSSEDIDVKARTVEELVDASTMGRFVNSIFARFTPHNKDVIECKEKKGMVTDDTPGDGLVPVHAHIQIEPCSSDAEKCFNDADTRIHNNTMSDATVDSLPEYSSDSNSIPDTDKTKDVASSDTNSTVTVTVDA